MTESPSCADCFHWNEQTDSQDEVRWGYCRRFPPVVVPGEEGPECVVAWTELPHICGEFAAKQ